MVNKSIALGAEASAEDFEDALDAAIDDPEIDSVVAVYVPPLNVSGEDVANVLAAVGEQSDKPLVSSFLGAEGVPELLRVPDVAGSTAGRGSVPSYPGVEAAVRALARVVEYAVWLRTPAATRSTPPPSTPRARSGWSTRPSPPAPRGPSSTSTRSTALLAAYGIELWQTRQVASVDEAVAAGEAAGLGRGAEGDRRAPARAARPGPRVAQHRRSPRRCAGRWTALDA